MRRLIPIKTFHPNILIRSSQVFTSTVLAQDDDAGGSCNPESASTDPATNYFSCDLGDECVTADACEVIGGIYFLINDVPGVRYLPLFNAFTNKQLGRRSISANRLCHPQCYSSSFTYEADLDRVLEACGGEGALCMGTPDTVYTCSDGTVAGPDCHSEECSGDPEVEDCCGCGHCDEYWLEYLADMSGGPGDQKVKRQQALEWAAVVNSPQRFVRK